MAASTSTAQHEVAGKVLHGTCGWTDASIGTCGRFYPAGTGKSAEARLAFYCRHFACVEVDTSTYAIPSPESTAKWAKAILPGLPFRFHVKAFGLFTHQSAPHSTLPWQTKQRLGQHPAAAASASSSHGGGSGGPGGSSTTVKLSSMPPEAEQATWDAFHACLEPFVAAGLMGVVVFQFQLSFRPSQASRDYVVRCRGKLRPDVRMAVEFRDRAWFRDAAALEDLAAWCRQHQLYLIAADELKHETFQKDREQTGLPPGQVKQILPMSLAVTLPDMLVIRLHRRHGTTDRLLPQHEHEAWARRLDDIAPQVQGPIYFLWGTDWEDAPVVNARALDAALPSRLRHPHAALAQQHAATRKGTIGSLFAKARAADATPAPAPLPPTPTPPPPPSTAPDAAVASGGGGGGAGGAGQQGGDEDDDGAAPVGHPSAAATPEESPLPLLHAGSKRSADVALAADAAVGLSASASAATSTPAQQPRLSAPQRPQGPGSGNTPQWGGAGGAAAAAGGRGGASGGKGRGAPASSKGGGRGGGRGASAAPAAAKAPDIRRYMVKSPGGASQGPGA